MFALLAFAGVYQTFRSQAALDWIDKTLALLDDHYYDAVRGGFAESIPRKLPRRQNSHMHYLEAMLALYEATDDRYFLTRATTVVTLFREKFLDFRTGTLCGTFGSEWNRDSGPSGHKVEPGHHFEWVWLLDRYGHASGDNVCEADQLYDFALSRGLSSTDEFVVDGLSSEGSIIAGTKRLWPQAEMLKALVSKSRRGDAKAMRRIVPHVERMFDKYFIPGNGRWHDQLDAEGKVISTLSPASTFHHIYIALEES